MYIKIDALLEDVGGEQPGGPWQGSGFQNLHVNKRAMTLNLKDDKDWSADEAHLDAAE